MLPGTEAHIKYTHTHTHTQPQIFIHMDINQFENVVGFADAFTSVLQEDKLQEKAENHPVTKEDHIPGSVFPHFPTNI